MFNRFFFHGSVFLVIVFSVSRFFCSPLFKSQNISIMFVKFHPLLYHFELQWMMKFMLSNWIKHRIYSKDHMLKILLDQNGSFVLHIIRMELLIGDTIKELMSYPKCRSVKVINNLARPGSIHKEINFINYK